MAQYRQIISHYYNISVQKCDLDCQMAGHFLRSQTVTREHRKRKTALIRAAADRSWEEADIEEQKCFEAFINQLGADNIFEE